MQTARYIPFSKHAIITMCAKELNKDQQTSFKQLCELLASLIHFHYHGTLESLKNNYAPFDPNSDTRLINSVTDEQKAQCQRDFAKDFAKVLAAANFGVLPQQEMLVALHEASV
ncbi:DUF3754 domain-containing protein, partial [Pseudoalteromonas sp. S1609]